MSRICLVWAAEMQKRTLDSMMGVAGKPTTTTPMFLFSISLPKALVRPRRWGGGYHLHSSEAQVPTTRTAGLPTPPETKRSLSL